MLADWVIQECPAVSTVHRETAIVRQGHLTKPTGALGRLETLAIDLAGLQHAEEAGGLSGAPVREASNRVIGQLRSALGSRFPIIGVGTHTPTSTASGNSPCQSRPCASATRARRHGGQIH